MMLRVEAIVERSQIVRRWATVKTGNPIWLVVPVLILLAVVYAFPLINMLRLSLYESARTTIHGDDLTTEHYIRFFTDSHMLGVLFRSLWMATAATIAALVIGYPLAWIMARGPAAIRSALLLTVLLPIMVSVVVRSYAWTVLLGLDGPINTALTSIGIVDRPIQFTNSPLGVIIGLTYVYLPFMVLPLSAVLAKIDPEVEAAAYSLGASGLQVFRRIIVPMSVPGIAAGSVLVFTLSIAAYVTPALIGGAGVQVMTTFVANQILVILNWPVGSTIAAVLMFIVVFLMVVYSRWVEKRTRFYRGAEP